MKEPKDMAIDEVTETLRLMKKMPSASQEEKERLLERATHHHNKAMSHLMDDALDAVNRGEISVDELKDTTT